jgi:hypothetical protein
MALRARQRAQGERPAAERADFLLLATFDPSSGKVPEQGVKVSAVIDQSRRLGTRLLLVPVQVQRAPAPPPPRFECIARILVL